MQAQAKVVIHVPLGSKVGVDDNYVPPGIDGAPTKSGWLTVKPYPYEPPETRGDHGTCCGDCPGNALGLTLAGVFYLLHLFGMEKPRWVGGTLL